MVAESKTFATIATFVTLRGAPPDTALNRDPFPIRSNLL